MIVSRSLTETVDFLDLVDGVGQRSVTFRFDLLNGVTGEHLGELTPLRAAALSHDTSRTIKRQLRLPLGVADAAEVNPINNRVDVTMIMGDASEWPLGRYVFTDYTRQEFSSGQLVNAALTDEMITVDQQITTGLGRGQGTPVVLVIQEALASFNFTMNIESSPYASVQSWGPGAARGQILENLALVGDYFSPWFGNDRQFHFIRAFDPAQAVPDFNFDTGNQVFQQGIVNSDDTLIAPNQFVVVSNGFTGSDMPTVGIANVPDSAPHSIANRGFVVSEVVNLQVQTGAQAVAQNLAYRQEVAERVSLLTAIDPRHDSYDVILWQNEKWLETAWSMQLVAGGAMTHNLRKTYS